MLFGAAALAAATVNPPPPVPLLPFPPPPPLPRGGRGTTQGERAHQNLRIHQQRGSSAHTRGRVEEFLAPEMGAEGRA